MAQTIAELGEAQGPRQPDDLMVFFLAGHGIVDEDTQKYYFVGHDFKLADLGREGLFGLHLVGGFPVAGRHSLPQAGDVGHVSQRRHPAAAVARSENGRAAIAGGRDLHGDGVDGRAARPKRPHGNTARFTRCLLEALNGGAGSIARRRDSARRGRTLRERCRREAHFRPPNADCCAR